MSSGSLEHNLEKLHGEVVDCLGIGVLEVLVCFVPLMNQRVSHTLSCGEIGLFRLKFRRIEGRCILRVILDERSKSFRILECWIGKRWT